jgi:ADP-ribosylglycohydrolase
MDLFALRDACRAVLLGAAAADALGLLTEFLPREEAQDVVAKARAHALKEGGESSLSLKGWERPSGAHRASWAEGDWTDDTDQQVLLMMAIVAAQGKPESQTGQGKHMLFDPVDLGRRLSRWMDAGLDFAPFHDTKAVGAGSTTKMVLSHPLLVSGSRPDLAAFYVWGHPFTSGAAGKEPFASASNGSVMRCAVIGAAGAAASLDLSSIGSAAAVSSRVTHADPRCSAACAFVATLVAQLIRWRALQKPGQAAESDDSASASASDISSSPSPVSVPSAEFVERAIATSCAIGEAVMLGDLADLATRASEVADGMEKVSETDYRGTGTAVLEEFRTGEARVRDACVPGVLAKWAAAKTLAELELGPDLIGFVFKPLGCAVVSLRRLVAGGNATEVAMECIEEIVAEGADADTNATVAGAVLGAACGFESGLFAPWIRDMQHADWLIAETDKLVESCRPAARENHSSARFDVG